MIEPNQRSFPFSPAIQKTAISRIVKCFLTNHARQRSTLSVVKEYLTTRFRGVRVLAFAWQSQTVCIDGSDDGKVTRRVHGRYQTYDPNPKRAEAIEADAEDLLQLEDLERELKKRKPEEDDTP